MTTLITYAGTADAAAPVTRTGGVPLVPAGFRWPRCAECGGPMQFLAHLVLADLTEDGGVLSIFMCQNEPGRCGEWEPASGANLALVLPLDGLAPAPVPTEGVALLPEVSAGEHPPVAEADYEQARDRWAATAGRSPRHVLGQFGGPRRGCRATRPPSVRRAPGRWTSRPSSERAPTPRRR